MKFRSTFLFVGVSLLLVLTACTADTTGDASASGGQPASTSAPTTIFTAPTPPETEQPTPTEPEKMCTAMGCVSLLTIELSDVDIQPEQTYDVEICVDGDCRTESITIDSPHPGTGEIIGGESVPQAGTLDGWMRVSVDDSIHYHLPQGEYGGSTLVSFTLTSSDGEGLAHVEDVEVSLERYQPNGPDCPPVCFSGRLTL